MPYRFVFALPASEAASAATCAGFAPERHLTDVERGFEARLWNVPTFTASRRRHVHVHDFHI